ncbi:hypothetical protein BV25DRAFT_1671123 [Artomyces pyxidatus]|uniref:Uncharacterized protein n=1 Tax=Artomyces pyxidatus TaxID=48021 RepID=A0ACB8SI70_9AGAM|nr:hypothetical protein BV25DRAFT_1671123 [Artomyces pyxidatus]
MNNSVSYRSRPIGLPKVVGASEDAHSCELRFPRTCVTPSSLVTSSFTPIVTTVNERRLFLQEELLNDSRTIIVPCSICFLFHTDAGACLFFDCGTSNTSGYGSLSIRTVSGLCCVSRSLHPHFHRSLVYIMFHNLLEILVQHAQFNFTCRISGVNVV